MAERQGTVQGNQNVFAKYIACSDNECLETTVREHGSSGEGSTDVKAGSVSEGVMLSIPL